MNLPKELLRNKNLQNKLSTFLNQHGFEGLENALDSYSAMQQEYICRSENTISKIHISDIDYIKIQGHHMTIHTQNGTYHKYGSLSRELKTLGSYGFVKCSQNCIVSLHKIKCISQNTIFLQDGTEIHISRSCISAVLLAYSRSELY